MAYGTTAASPTTEEGELLSLIHKRVGISDVRPERYYLEDAALLNLAYWSGKQRVYYQNRTFTDATSTLSDEEVSYQINLIRGRVLAAVARVIGVNAEFKARPNGSSARDREIAALSDRVFDHARVVTDFEMVRTMATLWAAICGTAYIKCSWDPLLGEPDRFYKLDKRTSAVIPEVMLTPEARVSKEEKGEFEDFAPGDLSAQCLSPFAGYQDFSSRDAGMAGAQWFAERHWVDRETIAERWGMDVKDIPPMDPQAGLRNYEEAIAFMSTGPLAPLFSWTTPADKVGKRTLYVEMWERPSRRYKRGRRVVYAGGKILNLNRAGGLDNPYAADRTGWAHIPYVKVDWIPHPGRFWGASMVEDMIQPQFALNRARSNKLRFMDIFGVPDTYISDATGLDVDSMEAGGGRIYQVNSVGREGVQHGPPPQMPTEIAMFGNECERDLNSVASQAEIDGAKLPGQMRSGAAIKAMAEERYMPLSVPAKMSVRVVRDAGRCLLAIHKLKAGKRRLSRMGEDNEWIVEEYEASSIATEIHIIGEPSIMDTANASKAEMLDAVQSGVFNPQFDEEMQDLIFSGMHYKTGAEFAKRRLQAKRNAERVIQTLIRNPGKYPQGYPVAEWQDHAREMREVVAFMYTEEFSRLPVNTQAEITLYWKNLQAFVAQAMQQELEMQAALKGTPGEKGQASQPAK